MKMIEEESNKFVEKLKANSDVSGEFGLCNTKS